MTEVDTLWGMPFSTSALCKLIFDPKPLHLRPDCLAAFLLSFSPQSHVASTVAANFCARSNEAHC